MRQSSCGTKLEDERAGILHSIAPDKGAFLKEAGGLCTLISDFQMNAGFDTGRMMSLAMATNLDKARIVLD